MIAALWLCAGFAGGVAHFSLLRWNTLLYVTSRRHGGGYGSHSGIARAIGLQVLRLATIALLLGFAAWHGALPLLLAALGIMLARPLVLRGMRVAP